MVLLSATAFLAGMWAAMRGVFPYPQASAAYSYLVYVAQLARRGPYRDDEFHLPCPT